MGERGVGMTRAGRVWLKELLARGTRQDRRELGKWMLKLASREVDCLGCDVTIVDPQGWATPACADLWSRDDGPEAYWTHSDEDCRAYALLAGYTPDAWGSLLGTVPARWDEERQPT